MLDLLQHLPLIICMLDLLHLDHLLFLQDLDSIETLVMLGLDQVNPAKTSSAQCPLYLKVPQRIFSLRLPDDCLLWLSIGIMALASRLTCAIVLRRMNDVVDGGMVLLLRHGLRHICSLTRRGGLRFGCLLRRDLCG